MEEKPEISSESVAKDESNLNASEQPKEENPPLIELPNDSV